MTIRRELLDELLKAYETPQEILGEGGLLKGLTKVVIECCLETELDTHLGYPKHGRKGAAHVNDRNGQCQKTLKDEKGLWTSRCPVIGKGPVCSQLVQKGQTRLDGTDRQNPGHVCPRDDHPLYSGAIAGTLWRGSVPHPDFGR